MEVITWNEIEKRIAEDSEINFIAEAMTPLHVLGIEALIYNLEQKQIKCKGFILAVNHSKTGRGLSEDSFHTGCYNNVEPVFFAEDNRTKNTPVLGYYWGLNRPIEKAPLFYYATPLIPSFDRIASVMRVRTKNELKVYITEEGTGSCVINPYSISYYRLFSPKVFNYPRIILIGIMRNRWFWKKLYKSGRLDYFTFLKKDKGELVPNAECAQACVHILKSENHNDSLSKYYNAVVFLPSLLYEANIINRRCDIEVYKEIMDVMGEENYIVKPHPREKNTGAYGTLGCFIESDHKKSFESIFANLEEMPKCIIGDTGSTLVNLNVLFGVKTVSINKIINRDDLLIKDYFDSFNKTFKNIVFIPETKEELWTYLRNL